MRRRHGSGDPGQLGRLERSRTREPEKPDAQPPQHDHRQPAEPQRDFAMVDDDFPSEQESDELQQTDEGKHSARDFQSGDLWIHGVSWG